MGQILFIDNDLVGKQKGKVLEQGHTTGRQQNWDSIHVYLTLKLLRYTAISALMNFSSVYASYCHKAIKTECFKFAH